MLFTTASNNGALLRFSYGQNDHWFDLCFIGNALRLVNSKRLVSFVMNSQYIPAKLVGAGCWPTHLLQRKLIYSRRFLDKRSGR